MDTSKVFYDMIDGYDYPKGEAEPIFEKYELQKDQEDFLYKIEELWCDREEEEYKELLTIVLRVLHQGWYNDEEQFDLREVTDLYRDDLER